MQDEERPDLSGERADLTGSRVTPASPNPDAKPDSSGQQEPSNSAPAGGFDLNRPTIVSLLYAGGYVTVITAIIGVVLGYVWKGEKHEAWETSHYDYLIRTFWIGLIGTIVGAVLTIVLIGVLILLAVAVQVVVRIVLSVIAAQKREPMPNPDSWLI